MTGARRGLGRDVAVYGLSTVLIQIVAFATTPVYTRLLGPSSYGVLELLGVTVSFVMTAIFDGVGLAAVRFYATEPEEERVALLSTGFFAVLAGTAVGVAAAIAFAPFIARDVFGAKGASEAVVAAAIYLIVGVAARYSLEILRVQRRPWPYLLSSLLTAGVGGAIAIVFVAVNRGVEGVYYGLAAGAFVGLLCNLIASGHALGFRFSGRQLRRLVVFGGPVTIAALSGWSLVFVDRLILVHFVSLRQIGFYGLANRLAGILFVATYAFGTAWTPYIFEVHAADPAVEPKVRADVLERLIVAITILGVAVGLFAREAVQIIAGKAFLPAADVMPTLALGIVLFSTLTVVQVPFLIAHRTAQMARLSLSAAALNVAACFALIPPYGIQGAAVATAIGFGVQAIAYYHQAQRRLPAPYNLRRLSAIIGLALPFLAAGWIRFHPLILAIAIDSVLLCVYAGLLVVFRLVDVRRLAHELKLVRPT
ncbi:MAG: polysaccharide biosynthesis protein [Acidimicrobiia bacterium]|nr:polysaccharide biosynthesis protein [Acidimicrobiia bacterium]